jgi:O-antigen/teichoic acid export membrane protein
MLDPADFGAVVALLGVAIVGQVPGLALQAVIARHIAVAPAGERARLVRSLLRHAVVVGALVAAVAALAATPMAHLLHLHSPAAMLWLAAALWPTTVVFAVQGVLQGGERFGALAMLLVGVAVTRVAGGVAGGVSGPGGVFLGVAAGAVVVLGLALWLVRTPRGTGHMPLLAQVLYAELWPAIVGVGALLALTNIDVVLARHFLSGPQSGLYAAGTVASKIAFWFPQAVAMVVFPRLADSSRSPGLLGRAAAVIVGLGVVTSAGCALLGPWVFGILLGQDYTRLGPVLGLFAAAGAAGTLVQLALYSGIAVRNRLLTACLVAALATLVTVVWTATHSSMLQIVCTVLVVLSTVAAIGLAISWRRLPGRARA